ncbi:Esl2p PWA37_004709 [Arxiozyma heterogenica]|uniref:Esl2p n=1 Tax=Arxiozyma heterogenica TaxID=278026 RepID=UPI002F089288
MPQLAISPYFNITNNHNLINGIMNTTSEFNVPDSSTIGKNIISTASNLNNSNINNNNNNNNNNRNNNSNNNTTTRQKRHVSTSYNIQDFNFHKKRITNDHDFVNYNYNTYINNPYKIKNGNNTLPINTPFFQNVSKYPELTNNTNITNKNDPHISKNTSTNFISSEQPSLPIMNTPINVLRKESINKNSVETPQPSLGFSEQGHSPYYITNNSYTNLKNYKNGNIDNTTTTNHNNLINSDTRISEMLKQQTANTPLEHHNYLTITELTNSNKPTFIDNSNASRVINNDTKQNNIVNDNDNNNNKPIPQEYAQQNVNNNNNISGDYSYSYDYNNNNQDNSNINQDNDTSERYNNVPSQNGNHNSNNNNNNNNSNNGNPNSNNDNNDNSKNKKSSQALVQKLQEIYKVIVRQEIELQERCSQLTTSHTTELKNLWTIYRINTDLINNYTTFITTALLPSQSPQDTLIGEEIVEIYRIERRLWVYGTITFLDVLKNFSNFMDPEVCAQFITHVFISLSAILIDIPQKHAIQWLQRLGDLSRMAIALYPSGFIDWKLSAEYWYMEAMKFIYGHGKLYYHMSTVQQNTLEAFVNLGKSVFCQDTFTPSQQYMQLVIDNIYQRTFVERSSTGSYRNADLIDYLKHSEVMLLPSFLGSSDLQQVVLNYFQDRFGIDFNDNNIFNNKNMFCQPPASLRFFFRHAPAFAESHILQLIGFGDPKNPFALLFDLPKYLKERKDKKEKNKSKSSSSNGEVSNGSTTTLATTTTDNDINEDIYNSSANNLSGISYLENVESLKYPIEDPDICTWIKSLDYINMTSLRCSMIVLKKFLHAPFVITLPHLLPWTYFIIASGLKIKSLNDEKSYKFWKILMKRIFPWNTITSFLNVLLAYILDNFYESHLIEKLSNAYSQHSLEELLEYFNENEDLPEIWKCWGTLWFDVICDKHAITSDTLRGFGINDHMFLDFPIDGIGFDSSDETGEKFWRRAIRIIFLFKGIAENFDFGLKVNYNTPVFCNRNDVKDSHILRQFSFKLEPYNEPTSTRFNEFIPMCEKVDDINADVNSIPELSLIPGENIFEYAGYRKLSPDFNSYDKNGEFIGSSIYTSWISDQLQTSNSNNIRTNTNLNQTKDNVSMTGDNNSNSNSDNDINYGIYDKNTNFNSLNDIMITKHINEINENDLFKYYMDYRSSNIFINKSTGEQFRANNIWRTPYDEINRDITYFVFDATSWLRHFAHIYKLATNEILKFAVCLTTFQELRFLRKSKDENVVEAASRAVITIRQLYAEGKLLPLRFTGNVATDIEEHLEFEEQITWRSHVDEFVIEAVVKAQNKFTSNRSNNMGCYSDLNGDVLLNSLGNFDSFACNNSVIMHSGTPSSTTMGSIVNEDDITNMTPSNAGSLENDNGDNTITSNGNNGSTATTTITTTNNNRMKRFQYIVLVTNDQNMKRKAQDQNIKTFSTDFIFTICSKLGMDLDICTN